MDFLGHRSDPLRPLQACDWFVLPSLSEGLPRAALEALYFGIPCILRDVDANRELIRPGVNGYLFHSDEDLLAIMRDAVRVPDALRVEHSLLPADFGQGENCREILRSIENV